MTSCRCAKQHRSQATLAACVWPRAEWIAGNGRFALLAHCDVLTVTLHHTRAGALESKVFIDRLACGHACHRAHEIFELGGAA